MGTSLGCTVRASVLTLWLVSTAALGQAPVPLAPEGVAIGAWTLGVPDERGWMRATGAGQFPVVGAVFCPSWPGGDAPTWRLPNGVDRRGPVVPPPSGFPASLPDDLRHPPADERFDVPNVGLPGLGSTVPQWDGIVAYLCPTPPDPTPEDSSPWRYCPESLGTQFLCGGVTTSGNEPMLTRDLWPALFDTNPPPTGIGAPEVVALVTDNGTLVCSGTLVSAHHVLTAAHCFGEGAQRWPHTTGPRRDPELAIAVHDASVHPSTVAGSRILGFAFPEADVGRDALLERGDATSPEAGQDVPLLDLAIVVLEAPLGAAVAALAGDDAGARVDGCVAGTTSDGSERPCPGAVAVGYGYGPPPPESEATISLSAIRRYGYVDVVGYLRQEEDATPDDACPACRRLHAYFVAVQDEVQICNFDSGGGLFAPGAVGDAAPELIGVITHKRVTANCRDGSAFLRVDVDAIRSWVQRTMIRTTPGE